MQSIKVGSQRVVLDNVTNVEERISASLRTMADGKWAEDYYAKPEDRTEGLVVTAYFISSGESPDYVRFYMTEGEEFLRKFDALLAVQ